MEEEYTTTPRQILSTSAEARSAQAVTYAMRGDMYTWWINGVPASPETAKFIKALGYIINMGLERIEDIMLLYDIGVDDTLCAKRIPQPEAGSLKPGWTREVGEWAYYCEQHLRSCRVPHIQ